MATSKTLENQLAKLQASIEAEQMKYRTALLGLVTDALASFGLTVEDLLNTPAPKKRGRPAKAEAVVSKSQAKRLAVQKQPKAAKGTRKAPNRPRGPQPAKYRDPASGATWTGLARPPAWIKDVKDRSKFLIDGAA